MPITPTNPFKGRHYPGEVILSAVRWYLSCMALRATKTDENALYVLHLPECSRRIRFQVVTAVDRLRPCICLIRSLHLNR
jgi:hypothetical protein